MPGRSFFLIISSFLFFAPLAFPQKAQPGSGTDTIKEKYYGEIIFRNEDWVYAKNIKTVQLREKSFELSDPLIKLNSDQQLLLSFDDLDAVYKTYNYTFIHCTADWEPSDLSPSDYLKGFTEDIITDYKNAFNTVQPYIHYNITFPNDNIKFSRSGNYILKVYADGDPDKYIISRRFMIFDEKVSIDAQIRPASNVTFRNYKQQVNFTINHRGYDITDPYDGIHVVITQNNRWDNAITKLQPLFVKEDQLVYDYDGDDNIFAGGNEFRNFDIKSLVVHSERIVSITTDSLKNNVYIANDERRSFKRYTLIQDINGKYVVKIQQGNDSEREADYAFVHFFLPFDFPVTDGNLYVFGALSDWECKDENRMKYDYDRKGYAAVLYVKQGYYNYEYVLLKDNQPAADDTFIEGMHYETENEYTIYVYHHAVATSYDQLVGIKKINSAR